MEKVGQEEVSMTREKYDEQNMRERNLAKNPTANIFSYNYYKRGL